MRLRSKANLDGEKKGGAAGSEKKGRLRKKIRDGGEKKGGAGSKRKRRPRKKIRGGGVKKTYRRDGPGAGIQCKTLQGKKLNEGTKRLLRSCPQNEIAANLIAGVDEVKERKTARNKKRPAAKSKPRVEGTALSAKRSAPSRQDRDASPPMRAPPSPRPYTRSKRGNGATSGVIKKRVRKRRVNRVLAGNLRRWSARPGSDIQAVFVVEVPKGGRITRNVTKFGPYCAPPNTAVLPPSYDSDHLPTPENIPHLCETDNSAPLSVTGCGGSLDLSPIDSKKGLVLESQISHFSIENNESNCVDESETPPDNLNLPHKEELNLSTTQVLESTIGQTTFQEINSLPIDNICDNSQGTSTTIPHVSGFTSLVTPCNMIENYDRTDCLPCSSSFSVDGHDILVGNGPLASESTSNNNNIVGYPKTTCDELPSCIESITDDLEDIQQIIAPELNTVSTEGFSNQFCINSIPKPEPRSIKMNFIESSQSSQRERIESSLRPENELVTTSKENSATTLSNSCPNKKFSKIAKKKKNEKVTKVSVTVDKLENATKTSPFRQKEINKPSSGSADTTPSNSSPDKELGLKNLKPISRKKKTEEVAKTVKKAEPAIENKSSHTLHQTSSKDIVEVSKKSSIPKTSQLPTLKDNKSSSSSFGVSLPKALQPYCRGSLLRNSCLARYCSWKHEFTPDFFSRLSSSDSQSLIATVFEEAVEVSSSFVRAALEFFASRQLKTRILWLSGLFLKRQLFRSAIRSNQYFIEISTFLFTALNACGIQSPLERREIIEANKGFFASLSNDTINNVLNFWGINSSKPIWPVIQPLADMAGFALGGFLLQAVYGEIMANPQRETMKFFGNQLLKPDRQQFFIDPSRHYIIWNVIEKLPDFNLEYIANILTRKYSNIILSFRHLLRDAEQCFYRGTQTRQWQSSINCIIKALNTYNGDCRVKKAFLSLIFNIFNMNDPLINLKDFLKTFTWAVKGRFVLYKSFFGTLIFRFISHFARNSCWPVALGFFELLVKFNISPDRIMDMEEEPSTPLSRAMLFAEILFHNNCHERLVKFITSNGFTPLFEEPVQDSNSNIDKSIDSLNFYLAELIHSGETHLALSLFRFILGKQKCNEPVDLDKYFEVIITQLIEKNGLTEEPLRLYSALDGYVYPSCLYLRTLLIIALRFQKTDLIFDLFKKCLIAGCYPKIGMIPYTIHLLRSMTEDEMTMYIRQWLMDFSSRHFEGFRPPNAWWAEDGISPQATYKINIDFSPDRLSDSYDASSPPVIPNVLSQASENLDLWVQRVLSALQTLGLRFHTSQPPLYVYIRLSEDMWRC